MRVQSLQNFTFCANPDILLILHIMLSTASARKVEENTDKSKESEIISVHNSQFTFTRTKSNRRKRQCTAESLTIVAVTAAAWGSVKAGIQFFQLARRRALRHLLMDTAAALTLLNIEHWLDFGSLLGVHRNGDLILHDNDCDFAIFQPDWKSLQQRLSHALPGYSVVLVSPSDDPSVTFGRVYCALGIADLFGAHPIDENRLLVDCGHGDCTAILTSLVFPLKTIHWRGVNLSVPGNVDGTLEHRYGQDWKTPRYMDKGSDIVEHNKTYAKIFRALATVGIKI